MNNNIDEAIVSYRRNFPLQSKGVEDFHACTEPHWVSFLTGWTAHHSIARTEWKEERRKRIELEEAVANSIK